MDKRVVWEFLKLKFKEIGMALGIIIGVIGILNFSVFLLYPGILMIGHSKPPNTGIEWSLGHILSYNLGFGLALLFLFIIIVIVSTSPMWITMIIYAACEDSLTSSHCKIISITLGIVLVVAASLISKIPSIINFFGIPQVNTWLNYIFTIGALSFFITVGLGAACGIIFIITCGVYKWITSNIEKAQENVRHQRQIEEMKKRAQESRDREAKEAMNAITRIQIKKLGKKRRKT